MDYSKTLNLPRTDFPMKANLPQREPGIQKLWEEMDLYRLSLEREAPNGVFILHDGPPYSNGDVHVGNAMQNKLPKDFITRYFSMNGYRVPFVPGWDNHGMPIENNVAAEFRARNEKPDRMAIRRRCREYAAGWVEKQREQYIRLGIRGDWQRPYLTMDPRLEAAIVRVFGELAEKGFIYRGLRPIHWCPTCETALADAEIEYSEASSPSIYVFFPLLSDPGGVFDGVSGEAGALIWTTTPWTIPANLAIAAHPEFRYSLVTFDGRTAIVARDLLERVSEQTGIRFSEIKTVTGSELEGLSFRHPLFERPSPLVFADYVTLDEGTGLVHTAPGHGREDFETGKRYGLDVLCPVDERGIFTEQAGPFRGISIWEGDARVVESLREARALLADGSVEHSYPHCWRCHRPVIFRATVQWFMNLDHDGHRERVLSEIDRVEWLPPESINRIRAMVSGAPDWCVSRQRAWGVGIPVFFCNDCGAELLDRAVIQHVACIVEKESADAWFARPEEELLPEGTVCRKCGGGSFRKETDILDVWFDSGSTCRAVLDSGIWPELSYPADVYLEGNDQHRGWFNKSLMVGVATRGTAPFRKVVTNGWMVDAEGHAMHKSRGNVINTMDVVGRYGADVIRLAAASFNMMADARLGEETLQRAADAYRRIRNTFRFLLANLADFSPGSGPALHELEDLDRWMLARLQRLVARCRAAYEAYEFHRVTHEVHNFCAVDLSALYLDILKDRLYSELPDGRLRRSAQAALHSILSTLVRLVAPILVHTAEEVWQSAGLTREAPSVHLAEFPEPDESLVDLGLLERFDRLVELREEVYRHIEQARQTGRIGKPIEARVTVAAGGDEHLLNEDTALLASFFIVSDVRLEPGRDGHQVRVEPAPGVRCPRCWLVREDVGSRPDYPDLCGRCADVVSALMKEESS